MRIQMLVDGEYWPGNKRKKYKKGDILDLPPGFVENLEADQKGKAIEPFPEGYSFKNKNKKEFYVNPQYTTVYRELAKDLYEKIPYHYDKAKIWHLWNDTIASWELIDETDLMLLVDKYFNSMTESGKFRSSLLEALRKCGRYNKPKDIKPTWVQFGKTVYDIEDGTSFKASPEFFLANPIPWEVGDSEDTPEIDKLIRSWVAKEDVLKLYQLIAFTTVPEYFIHAFFFLYSPPGMGKSTYIELLLRFISKRNAVATSLKRINTNTRFETINWFRKLLITMSEVARVNDLKDSALINQATGGDMIGAEKKGGAMFDFINYGKFIYPTNKLVKVDPTDGFGRRVRVIKFVNRFEKEKNVLDKIPDWEYKNLAKKCLRLAGELYKDRQFDGDVSITDRMELYQQLSKSPLDMFLEDKCDLNDFEAKIKFDEFYSVYSRWCLNKKLSVPSKIMVGRELRKTGFEVKKIGWEINSGNIKDYIQENSKWAMHQTVFGIKFK